MSEFDSEKEGLSDGDISLIIDYWFRICNPNHKIAIANELSNLITKFSTKLWIKTKIPQRMKGTHAFCTKDNKIIIVGAQSYPNICLVNNKGKFNIIAKYPKEIKLYGHCVVQIPGDEGIFISFGGDGKKNQHLISYFYATNKIVNIGRKYNIDFNEYFIGQRSKSVILGNFNEFIIITGGHKTNYQLLIYSIKNNKFIYQNKNYSIKFGLGHSIIRIDSCKYIILTQSNKMVELFMDPYNNFNNSIRWYKNNEMKSLFGNDFTDYGIISVSQYIIYFGGFMGYTKDNRIYIYDTKSQTGYLSDITLPEKRSFISCVVIKDCIYFIGSEKTNNYWSLSISALFNIDFKIDKKVFNIL